MSQNQTPAIFGEFEIIVDFSDDRRQAFRSVGGLWIGENDSFRCLFPGCDTGRGYTATLRSEVLSDKTIVHTFTQMRGDRRRFVIRQIWDYELERHNFANFWSSIWTKGEYPKPIVQYDGILPLLTWLSQKAQVVAR